MLEGEEFFFEAVADGFVDLGFIEGEILIV